MERCLTPMQSSLHYINLSKTPDGLFCFPIAELSRHVKHALSTFPSAAQPITAVPSQRVSVALSHDVYGLALALYNQETGQNVSLGDG